MTPSVIRSLGGTPSAPQARAGTIQGRATAAPAPRVRRTSDRRVSRGGFDSLPFPFIVGPPRKSLTPSKPARSAPASGYPTRQRAVRVLYRSEAVLDIPASPEPERERRRQEAVGRLDLEVWSCRAPRRRIRRSQPVEDRANVQN